MHEQFLNSINPYDLQEIGSYPMLTADQTSSLIQLAHKRYLDWRHTKLEYRLEKIQKLEGLLLLNLDKLASMITLEMGKPISQSKAEIEKSIGLCQYYREDAAKILGPQTIVRYGRKAEIHHSPLGVALGIMPWNFPIWQVCRFGIPALISGNTVLLKHAPNVQGVAHLLQHIFAEAGFEEGCFTNLPINVETTAGVIAHPAVQTVSLTGSERAGRSVASLAGHNLKKSLLELGGSDAYVILDDADLATTAQICVESRLVNAGQSCIGAKRIILTKNKVEEFLDILVEKISKIQVGNPLLPQTILGPLANMPQKQRLQEQIDETLRLGARCVIGGVGAELPAAHFPATILTDIPTESPAYNGELFGPVWSIFTAKDEEDAFRMANDHAYGLGGAIFSKDEEKARQLAIHQLETGNIAVNSMLRSQAHLPFGGIKYSGYGKELGPDGMLFFCNSKVIHLN